MADDKSYWQAVARSRLSRRRMLGTMLGACGAAALAYTGCGNDPGEDRASSTGSILDRPVDRSKNAIRGGSFQSFESTDIDGLDPIAGPSARSQFVAQFAYSRLVKAKTSFSGVRTEQREGDLAESWEVAGDGTRMTFKLRPDAVWDRREPTSRRPVLSEDVRFSFERFEALNPGAGSFFYSKNAAAPLMKVETPDIHTVVLKLAFPFLPLVSMLARANTIWTVPYEAEDRLDLASDVRGSGPWVLSSHVPGQHIEFARNQDFYIKDRPFLSGWSAPIIPDRETQLTRFREGEIWAGVAQAPDVLPLKRALPRLQMFQGDYGTGTSSLFFGVQGPFRDARVRQAVSKMFDRDLLADTLMNLSGIDSEGVPRSIRINSHIGAGWEGLWIDPYDRGFGPNARYFKKDLAEAGSLLRAARVDGILASRFFYPENGYGASFQQTVQALAAVLNDTGLCNITTTPLDYSSEYVPTIHYGGGRVGNWDGIALTPGAQGDDAGHQLYVLYHSRSSSSRQAPGTDPTLDQMIDAELREADVKKRTTQIQDIQRYMPQTMITVPIGYQSPPLTLNWPWVVNAGAVRGGAVPPAEVYPHLWFDPNEYERSRPRA